MSAVLASPIRPALDRDGMHWQMHGQAVTLLPRVGSASLAGLLAVHSRRHPRYTEGLAHVVLELTQDPFTLAAHLSPAMARALARNLDAAADRAETVAAVVGGRRS